MQKIVDSLCSLLFFCLVSNTSCIMSACTLYFVINAMSGDLFYIIMAALFGLSLICNVIIINVIIFAEYLKFIKYSIINGLLSSNITGNWIELQEE